MNSKFDPEVIRRGLKEKRAIEDNPTSGMTVSGSTITDKNDTLGKDPQRMAGPGGAFAMKMMQDPEFANEIAGWRNMYNQTPQGVEFNAAMMNQQQQAMDVQGQETDMVAQQKEVEQM